MFATASAAPVSQPQSLGPVTPTIYGPVRGLRLGSTTVYHGVPFAEPPLQHLRWKSPQPPQKWTEVKDTVAAGPVCSQMDIIKGQRKGEEDCLYLSVYVPDGCTAANPCPVMQWIYGGAWITGSNAEHDGEYLAKTHNVVVVAANYRLDSLGWLALRELQEETDDGSFGNYGLHDQRAAMRWTQGSIQAFGGDPYQVTIFGESAGGWSVCQHLVSPQSNRLFSHAIIESGDCDGPWMIFDGDDAQMWGEALTTRMGCSGPDRLSCLRSKPLKDVMLPYVDFLCPFPTLQHSNPYCNQSAHDANATGGLQWPTARPPFAPVVGYGAVIDRTDRGLPDTPIQLINKGLVNVSPLGKKVSVMLGTNTDEFALFLIAVPFVIHGTHFEVRNSDFHRITQHVTEYHRHWNKTTATQIEAAYPAKDYKHPAARLAEAATDFCFRCGTRIAARALAAAGIDTYLYTFDFKAAAWSDTDSLLCELKGEVGCGVQHTDEIPYIFGNIDKKALHPKDNAKKEKMMKTMGTYWTNLAKYGTPNNEEVPVQWPRYVEAEDKHLILAEKVEVSSQLAKPKCDFWDTLPREGPYSSFPFRSRNN